MKKLALSAFVPLLLTAPLMAGVFEDNLTQILKETGHKVKVISSKELVGMNQMRIVNVEFSNTTGVQRMPFLATSDGKGAVIFSNLFFSADKKSNGPIIEDVLREVDQFNETKKNAQLNDLFKGMAAERFIDIPSTQKGITKTMIIVSSPDCPYCRDELEKIDEHLKESNVRMVIVPLSGANSLIKAQIAHNEAKAASSTQDKIKALQKVYAPNYKIPEKQKNINTDFVAKTADIIFKSGLIRGVPYTHIMQD